MSGAAFEQMMREGLASGAIVFTNGKDATDVCIPQHQEGLLHLLGTEKYLNYGNLGWGPAEAKQVAGALAYAQEMGTAVAAETLFINGNQLGSEGVRAIGEVIEAGALPRLKELYISDNGADADTVEWIKRVAEAAGCTYVEA